MMLRKGITMSFTMKVKNNSKTLWTELSRISGNSTTNGNYTNSLNAEQLNDNFSNIGLKTVDNMPSSMGSYGKDLKVFMTSL